MTDSSREPKVSSKPSSVFLKSTSGVSLNERFSRVLLDQQTQPMMVTFNPVQLQQRRALSTHPVVLLVKEEVSSALRLQGPDVSQREEQCLRMRRQRRRRGSVWTRLGWTRVTCHFPPSRPRGFWSFRDKYRWSARFISTYRRRRKLQSQLSQRRHSWSWNTEKVTAGQHLSLHLPRRSVTVSRKCGLITNNVPTKKELDTQLDEYMSLTRSRLDKQLDDYMSMSRSRLDADLDEYMLMSGSMQEKWD